MELQEEVALARRGVLPVRAERFSLDGAPEANRTLERREVDGRVLVVPD